MKRSKILASLAIAVLTVGLASCAGGEADAGTDGSGGSDTKSGGTLTLASNLDNNSFDPAALEIGNRVQYWMPVYDTLLVLDEDSEPQPNLVTEWAYNDDATELNLTLRDDVTFTDGEAFDAAAVQANLAHLAAGGGQNAYMAASIVDFDIVDEYELNLVLSAPDPGLLGYLGVVAGAMASPDSLTAADVATTPVGSGPYTLDAKQTTSGSQYVYVRNDDYWNADAFAYDKLVIKPMSDITARLNAIKSGQVNAALADAKSVADAESSGLQVNTTAVDWVGLFIADRDGTQVPALADVRVRQAINMVFNTEGLVKNVVLGQGEPTDQIFNPTAEIFDVALDGAYPNDVEAAQKLMAEAGFADGFTVMMPEVAAFSALNPIIEQTLGQLKIAITWNKEAPDATIGAVLSGKYPLFLFQLGSQSSWQDIQKAVLPTSPWNPFRVQNDELSSLVAAAQTATGDDQVTAMQAVNTWLVDNAWFDPWYRVNTIYLTDAKTDVGMQSQNVVPWIRNFTPAD
ncbi:ABC transporter substrate-binding protein [Microbacterium sp. A84]|uniref:ABC transporter substrate-binding protein n=1 Tax=Microbacterium sp. A84 TaxID=3450715 RepID=UPI003F433BCB